MYHSKELRIEQRTVSIRESRLNTVSDFRSNALFPSLIPEKEFHESILHKLLKDWTVTLTNILFYYLYNSFSIYTYNTMAEVSVELPEVHHELEVCF